MTSFSEEASYDAVVIGGGMVGISAALALQARALQVAVVDPGNNWQRASYGNAGVVSPAIITPLAGPEVWRSLPRYLRNADPGLRLRYRDSMTLLPWSARFLAQCNHAARERAADSLNLLLAHSIDDHRALASELKTTHWLREAGWLRLYRTTATFKGSEPERQLMEKYGNRVEVLDTAAISALEPHLPRCFERALFLPDTVTVLHPGQLVERAHEAFRARGGVLLATRASRIEPADRGTRIITQKGNILARTATVLAAGAYSSKLARILGYHIPLIAGRGYHVHVPLPSEKRLTRSITNVNGAYGIAPDETGVRIGTGIELTQPDRKPDHYQIRRALTHFTQMMKLDPAILQETLLQDRIWMGSRPMTPDGLPVLGRAPRHEGIIFAFGHNHFGLASGPTTGRIVADLVTGHEPPFTLRPFDIARFMH